MSINTDPAATVEPVTVVIDPRVAYRGFGPDDGALAQVAREYRADDVIDDLADAAEQLDFAYARAWANAARRVAPDLAWDVSAPRHQPVGELPLRDSVATIEPAGRSTDAPLDAITAAVTVEVETLSLGATRWVVLDGGRMVGSATVAHTLTSMQDRHTDNLAAHIRNTGEVLRSVTSGTLRLDLFEPTRDRRSNPSALGYMLADGGAVIFAGTDFRPSPLHGIDSDRAVEALAEFLALGPGDADSEHFATYTERGPMPTPQLCLDNAVIESWHSTLEFELRKPEHFTTKAPGRAALVDSIKDYNADRKHSALGMRPPLAHERSLREEGGSGRVA